MRGAISHSLRTSSTGLKFSDLDLGSEAAVASFTRMAWMSKSQERIQEEAQWALAVSFFAGQQWVAYDWSSSRLIEMAKTSIKRHRYAVNMLLSYVEREKARVINSKMAWKRKAESLDNSDVAAARLGTKALRYLYHAQDVERKIESLSGWLFTTGNVFFRVLWDQEGGPKAPAQAAGPPGMEQLFAEAFGGQGVPGQMQGMPGQMPGMPGMPQPAERLGDVSIAVRSPFDVAWDTAFEMHESPWLIDADMLPTSQARLEYRDRTIQSAADLGSFFRVEGRGPVFQNQALASDSVLRLNFYTRPTLDFPNGFFAEVIGDRVLRQGPIELPFSGYPFVHLTEVTVPGACYGMSRLRAGLDMQRALNAARSSQVDESVRHSVPKYLRPPLAGWDEDDIFDPSKYVIKVQSMDAKPIPLERPASPQWVESQPARIMEEMGAVTSQNAATRGLQPGSVRSSLGITDLMEADAQAAAPAMVKLRLGFTKVGTMAHAFMAERYTQDRSIVLFGEDSTGESLIVSSQRLRGPAFGLPGIDGATIVTEAISGQPLTSIGREERAVRLVRAGILDPVQHRDILLRMVELDGLQEFRTDEETLETQNARRENGEMASGRQVPINPWDNDEIHLRELRSYEQSSEFRMLPPEIQQMFLMHGFEHVMRFQIALQNRVALRTGA